MATTTHYGLVKPAYTDAADIGDINDNMDTIDTELYNRKTKQTAVSSPTATGTASAFIDTISQDANGKITATKKTVFVSNAGVTLAWGTSKTIGSVAGTNLTATLPSKPAPTKAEVDSALGAGSGTTTYYRKDGTWATPPNTTYESKAAASGGTAVSLCTTGEKYTWNSKVSCTEANVKSALSIGSGSTFLRKDGSWATPTNTNTWRGYTIVKFTGPSAVELQAGAAGNLKGNQFTANKTIPSGYTAVSVLSVDTGSNYISVDYFDGAETGTGTKMRLRNHSSSDRSFTATMEVLYLQTGSP